MSARAIIQLLICMFLYLIVRLLFAEINFYVDHLTFNSIYLIFHLQFVEFSHRFSGFSSHKAFNTYMYIFLFCKQIVMTRVYEYEREKNGRAKLI